MYLENLLGYVVRKPLLLLPLLFFLVVDYLFDGLLSKLIMDEFGKYIKGIAILLAVIFVLLAFTFQYFISEGRKSTESLRKGQKDAETKAAEAAKTAQREEMVRQVTEALEQEYIDNGKTPSAAKARAQKGAGLLKRDPDVDFATMDVDELAEAAKLLLRKENFL